MTGNSASLLSPRRGIRPHLQLWGTWGSSRVAVGSFRFLLSCNVDLRVPLHLQQGSQASSQVEAGNSGFLLSCSMGDRSHLELRENLGFFSSCCRKLRVPLKLPQGRRASSRVEEGSMAFLSSCSREIRAPLELQWKLSILLELWHGTQGSSQAVARNLGSSLVGGGTQSSSLHAVGPHLVFSWRLFSRRDVLHVSCLVAMSAGYSLVLAWDLSIVWSGSTL